MTLSREIYREVLNRFLEDRSHVSGKQLEWVRWKLLRYSREDDARMEPAVIAALAREAEGKRG
jgi:hypothetical protein